MKWFLVQNYSLFAISRLALATTPTPSIKSSYTKYGPLFPSLLWSKSGSLLIRKNNPSYLYWGDSGLNLATTNNLINYTNQNGLWLNMRKDNFDSVLVEGGPMPLLLSDGNYLMLYNSARYLDNFFSISFKNAFKILFRDGYPSPKPGWTLQYNVGFVILNGSNPTQILQRSDKPILSPELPWEIGSSPYLGLTPNV